MNTTIHYLQSYVETLSGATKGIWVAAVGGTSIWVATDANRAFWVSIVGIVALVVYRKIRKFKQDRRGGVLDFIERNIVELILFSVIAPSAASTGIEYLMKLLG